MYQEIHHAALPRYSVPHLYLKEFTTTKSEKKKNKFRLPEETYRVPEEPAMHGPSVLAPTPDSFEENKAGSQIIYQAQPCAVPVTLADFKLIKKLGKGSFGTVLVLSHAL